MVWREVKTERWHYLHLHLFNLCLIGFELEVGLVSIVALNERRHNEIRWRQTTKPNSKQTADWLQLRAV